MDDFEATAEEWDNVIEIVPTFAKGQEISEAIILELILPKLSHIVSLHNI